MSGMALENAGESNQISIFVGNFSTDAVTADDLTVLFNSHGFHVARVYMKRGFAFVFADDLERKAEIVAEMNGAVLANATCQNHLRIELAQGTGSTKKNEDLRRSKISPSDTLFVVNFDSSTTTADDLSRLFTPFGLLKRVDIPHGKNYAFVAFENQDDAERAREGTNGGKLNQNVITVEFVARKFNENAPPSDKARGGRSGGRGGRGDDRRGGDRFDDRYDDRRGGDRYDDRRGGDRYDDRRGGDRYEDRRGGDRYDDRRAPPPRYDERRNNDGGRGGGRFEDRRGGSPPRGGYGGNDGGRGGRGGNHMRRSRSRSPPRRGRSPSPPGYGQGQQGYNGASLANPRGGAPHGNAPPQGGRFRDDRN